MKILFAVNGILSARALSKVASQFKQHHDVYFLIPKKINKNVNEQWKAENGLKKEISSQYKTHFFKPKTFFSHLENKVAFKDALRQVRALKHKDLMVRGGILLFFCAIRRLLGKSNQKFDHHTYWKVTMELLIKRAHFREFLLEKKHGYSALVVGENRNLTYIAPLLAEVYRMKIPAYLIQCSEQTWRGATEYRDIMQKGRKEVFFYKNYNVFDRIILKLFFSQNLINNDGIIGVGRYLFYALSRIYCLKIAGIKIGKPWIYGDFLAKKNFLFSDYYKDALLRHSANEETLHVVGDVSLDNIFTSSESAFSSDKHKIIYAVPHLVEHNMREEKEHFDEFKKTLEMFKEVKNIEIILSLHPHADSKSYHPIASEYGVKIYGGELSNVIASCDTLIAQYSSVIKWALMLEKKIIIFNTIGLENCFPEFFKEPLECKTIAELKDHLMKLDLPSSRSYNVNYKPVAEAVYKQIENDYRNSDKSSNY